MSQTARLPSVTIIYREQIGTYVLSGLVAHLKQQEYTVIKIIIRANNGACEMTVIAFNGVAYRKW